MSELTVNTATTSAPSEPPAAAPPVAPPEPPKKDEFAEKVELMARKEKKLYHERQRLAQEKQKLDIERSEYEKWKETKAKAKQNPLEYLSHADLDYDKITQFMLNGGKPTEKDELALLREEFAKMKEDQSTKEKQWQDQQTKSQQEQTARSEKQAIDTFKAEIAQFVEKNKEKYELSAQRDPVEEIYSTIQDAYAINFKVWNENGRFGEEPKPMGFEEAAEVVESFYEEELKKLTATKKWQSLTAPQEKKEPSKTLNNTMSASSAASVLPAKNDADRLARAMAKLSGS